MRRASLSTIRIKLRAQLCLAKNGKFITFINTNHFMVAIKLIQPINTLAFAFINTTVL